MSKSTVKIALRRDDVTIISLAMTCGCEPVFIGRSRECAMRVPSDENSVSGRHARLFWKGSVLYIEDAGSRNGVFHDGEQIRKAVRVRSKDLFVLGNCQISIGEFEKFNAAAAKKCHKLEFLNGDKVGSTIDIRPNEGRPEFSIGLDPACEIHLTDTLVSRKHAVLKVHDDGECWIEDTGSRNGTYVNGEKLSGKERLLKNGDKITIAYFDFRFLDRKFRHTRLHAWVKLASLAVSVCVVVAAYVIWTVTRSSVEEYMGMVRKAAAVGDFDAARRILQESRGARDAIKLGGQIDALAGQLNIWEKTRKDWFTACDEISAERFRVANDILNRLNEAPLDAWVWNVGGAASSRKEARYVGDLLRLYFTGREAVAAAESGTTYNDYTPVRTALESTGKFLEAGKSEFSGRVYLKPLMKRIQTMTAELETICSGFKKIDACLEQISSEDPDFRVVLSEFERLSADASLPASVHGYLLQQLDPCRAFVAVQDFLDGEFEALINLDFDKVLSMSQDIKLPDPEMCTRQHRYSDARALFLSKHESIQKEAVELRTMIYGLTSSGVTPDSCGDAITAVMSADNWRKALSFDCLTKRPPSPRRSEPSGKYDEFLCIEYTYESIRALPNIYNGRSMRLIGFKPICQLVRKTFEKAELFVQYLDNPDKRHLQRGIVGKYYTQCMKIAIDRENVVRVLRNIKGSKRKRLVAAFYAEYFTARPSYAAKRSIEAQFKDLSREVLELCDAYANESDPEKQIAIRDRILETGLPGDPAVHPKWVQKFN
ncbi:MAG: FHA domain-containing protein [Lentisphaerae bacterium]|nr:FHA domain-containing protein [Lentisphaerota bacterium]